MYGIIIWFTSMLNVAFRFSDPFSQNGKIECCTVAVSYQSNTCENVLSVPSHITSVSKEG